MSRTVGKRVVKSKSRPELISRQRVIEAALAAIDADGLENFSLGSVAVALGVRVPSLYYHFRDKAQILAEVARFLFLDTHVPLRAGDDWKTVIVKTALEARHSILRHPRAAPLLLAHPPRHVMLRGYEKSLELMERAGLPRGARIMVLSGIDAITYGFTLFEAASRVQAVSSFPNYDPSSFPSLSRIAGLAEKLDGDGTFEVLLRSFLDGLEEQPDLWADAGDLGIAFGTPSKRERTRKNGKNSVKAKPTKRIASA